MTAASLGMLVQEGSRDSKGLWECWVSRGRKVRWETEGTGDLQVGDPKACRDLLDYQVNLENQDTVKMGVMENGVHLVPRVSRAFLDLLVQPDHPVTAILRPVI